MTEKDYLKRIYRLVKRLLKSFNANNTEIESLKLKVKELEEKLNNKEDKMDLTELPRFPSFPHTSDMISDTYHSCEGCSNWEKIKRGEIVFCHCTIPYNKTFSVNSINSDLSNTLMQDFYKKENKNDK